MKTLETGCFIIIGRTSSGKPFRPSDWDQRLCSALSLFSQGKLEYSKSVMPTQHELGKAVYVDGALKESNPAMWKFVLDFAQANEMRIEWPNACALPKAD